MGWIEVTPAYGRDYTTAKAARADWNEGKDFRDTVSSKYINKADAERLGLKVTLRFDKSRKVASTK